MIWKYLDFQYRYSLTKKINFNLITLSTKIMCGNRSTGQQYGGKRALLNKEHDNKTFSAFLPHI